MTSWPVIPGQDYQSSNTYPRNHVPDNEQANTSSTATPYCRQQHAAAIHYTPGDYQSQRCNSQAAVGQEDSYQWCGNSARSNPTTQEISTHTTRRDGDDAQSRSTNSDDNRHNYDTNGFGNLGLTSRLDSFSTDDTIRQRSSNPGLLPNSRRQYGTDARYQTALQAPTSSNLSQNLYNREKSCPSSTHTSAAAAAVATAHRRQHPDATQSSAPHITSHAPSHTSSTLSMSNNYPKDSSATIGFQDAASNRSIPNVAYSSSYNQPTSTTARSSQNSSPSPLHDKKDSETSDTSARKSNQAPETPLPSRIPAQSQPQPQNKTLYYAPNHNSYVSNTNRTQHAVNSTTKTYENNLQRQQYSSSPTNTFQPSQTGTPPRLNGQQQVQKEASTQVGAPARVQSPHRPLTVDHNQVYSRFHEYQKQAEVAEREHARLIALRAVEEVAEAKKVAEAAERERLIDKTIAALKPVANSPSPQRPVATSTTHMHAAAEGPISSAQEDLCSLNQPAIHKVHSDLVDTPKETSQFPMVSTAMEGGMYVMVKKMREFQSRDPTVFSQSVEKDQVSSPGHPASSGVSAIKPSASVESVSNSELPSHDFPIARPSSSVPPETNILEAGGEAEKPKRVRYGRSKAAIAQRAAEKLAKEAAKQAQSFGNDPTQGKVQQMAVGEAPAILPVTPNPVLSKQSGPPLQQPIIPQVSRTPQMPQKQANIPQPSVTDGPSQVHPGTAPRNFSTPAQEVANRASKETPQQTTPVSSTDGPPRLDPSSVTVAQINTPAHANSAAKRSESVQTAPEPRSNPSSSNFPGLVWSQDHKDVFASTTISFIKSFPENSGIKIVPPQIWYMLNQNPSYVSLCEMIEMLGFKIDRAKLARALLTVVLDVGGSRAQQEIFAHLGPKPTLEPTDRYSQIQNATAGQSQTASSNAMVSQSTSAPTSAVSEKAHHLSITTHATQSGVETQTDPNEAVINVECSVNMRPPSRSRNDTQQVVASLKAASTDPNSRTNERGSDNTKAGGIPEGTPRPVGQTTLSRQSSALIPKNLQTSQITTPVTKTAKSPQISTNHGHVQDPTTPSIEDKRGRFVQFQELSPFSSPTLVNIAQTISNLNGPLDVSANSSNPPVTRPSGTPVPTPAQIPTKAVCAAGVKILAMSNQNKNQYKGPYSAPKNATPVIDPKTLELLSRSMSRRKNHISQDRDRSATVVPNAPTQILPSNRRVNLHHDVARAQSNAGLATNTPLISDGGFHKSYSQAMPRSPSSVGVQRTPAPEKPQVPMTKEQAARKRTFADIMSVTSCRRSPNAEEIYPPDKSRRMMPDITGSEMYSWHHVQNRQPSHTLTATPTQSVTRNIVEEIQPLRSHAPDSVFGFRSPLQYQHQFNFPPVSHAVAPNPYKDFEHIVQPLKIDDALPRAQYNPQTIARDILIATSTHPYQRGLNAHLETLKTNFTKVDDNSDLTTFRWDIVDPSSDLTISDAMDLDNVSDNEQVEASPRPLVTAVLTPALPTSPFQRTRDSPKLPDEAIILPPNAIPMIAVVIDNSNRGSFSEYAIFDDNDEEDGSMPASHPHRNSALPIHLMPKRTGRPPKHALSTDTASPAPRTRGRSQRHAPDQIREVGAEGVVSEKRGNPFGSATKNKAQSSRTSSEPHFSPFKCGWRGCPAEPQNLETLRLHVTLVHDDTTTCQWLECGALEKLEVPEAGKVYLQIRDKTFNDSETFRRHIEDAHISKYAWHMGDGPRSTTGGFITTTSYLNDSRGNEITPSIEGQKFFRRSKADMLADVRPATKIVPAKRKERSNKDASFRNFVGNFRRELEIGDPDFRFDVKQHTYFPKSAGKYHETMGIWAAKPGHRWLYDGDGYSEDVSESFRQADAAFEERKMEKAEMGMAMSPIPMLEGDSNSTDAPPQQAWYRPQ